MLDNFIPIWYPLGMRGNSIYRILAAHPEVYWEGDKSSLSINSLLTSLIISYRDKNILSTSSSSWLLSYITYHTTCIFADKDFKKVMQNWLATDNKKLLFTCVHPPINSKYYGDKGRLVSHNEANIRAKITDKQFKLLDKCNPHIWVYGTNNRFNSIVKHYAPSPESIAYNLNVDALFSKDYVTFETEYYKLIAHFNLTSCLNDIRAFILLVLEREEYIRKFW
jgi:hypothetical protein